MTDEMYDRLRAANPVPGTASVEAADSPGTRALMEAAMSNDRVDTSTTPTAPAGRSKWLLAGIAAAAAAIVLAGGLLLPDMLGDEPAPPAAALELAMPAGDTMGSCLPVSAEIMRDMPIAFAGTAVAVSDGTVTLDVDTWYKGGDAASVALTAPPADPPTSLGDVIDFQEGTRYLITATGGTVNICGFSGEATPELEAIFDDAFAG